MTAPWRVIDGPAGVLRTYATAAALGSPPGPMVVLCPELPRARGEVTDVSRSFPPLADRMAQESGFRVVVGMPRGVGGSEGDFSASGWLEDLDFLVGREAGDDPVWLVGFGLGGTLALRKAARDPRVRGVASLGAPADLGVWVTTDALAARCARTGVISAGYPPDEAAWVADLVALDPVGAAAALGGRPLLVMHGTEDDEVPPSDARALAEAASGPVDLKVVIGAGHWLRADPRVVAMLIGWVERQR